MRLTLLLCTPLFALASALPINDYFAKYDIYWRGLYAGELRHELQSGSAEYTFRQNSKPAFPLLPFRLDESATFVWENNKIVPLTYHSENQEGSRNKNESWSFNWHAMTLSSEKETLSLEKNAYDPLTQALAMRISLMNNTPVYHYKVLYKGALADWPFEAVGEDHIMTPKGNLKTIKLRQTRGNYYTLFWLSPAHNYLLVRFEKIRKDRVELTAQIMDFT